MFETFSRRTFLSSLVAATAAVKTTQGERPKSSAAVPLSKPDGIDWQALRHRFPFREDKVPMNAANLCPSPLSVSQEVTRLTLDIDSDCSFQNRAKFNEMLESSRRKVAGHLGASAEEIALVRNTSEANNIINNGLPLKAGDEVLLWDQNHPTNHVAWQVRAQRFGLQIRTISTPDQPSDPQELIDLFAGAINSKTRVLALTHLSNVSGLRLPIQEISEVAHRLGVYVHVDGAQTWGSLQVNLHELGCDSYSASCHKWFMGPKEAGVLFVRQERITEIWPSVVAPGWGDDADPDVKGARKFESLGQRDDACLAAIAPAADLHLELGSPEVESRVLELASRLKQGALEMGLELVTPAAPELSGGVCIFKVEPDKMRLVFETMYSRFGIAGAPVAGFRLSPHIYNTEEHIDRALAGLSELRGQKQI